MKPGTALSGIPWAVLAASTALAAPTALWAQLIVIGPQFVTADYRETSEDLHYQGTGFGGALAVSYRKLGLEVAYARLTFDPSDDGDAIEVFDSSQLDVCVRYLVAGPVSAEIGLTNRSISPSFGAQEVGAARVGARLSQLIDPAVRLSLRGNYLAGAKFSGGGSAPSGSKWRLA